MIYFVAFIFSYLQSEDLSIELILAYDLAYIEELFELVYHIYKTIEALDSVLNVEI